MESPFSILRCWFRPNATAVQSICCHLGRIRGHHPMVRGIRANPLARSHQVQASLLRVLRGGRYFLLGSFLQGEMTASQSQRLALWAAAPTWHNDRRTMGPDD